MNDLLRAIQLHIAVAAISSSAMRNQGAKGVAAAAREYLATIPLQAFSTSDLVAFQKELDRATEELRGRLPKGAQWWGTARKAANIFLRDSFYNKILHESFGLGSSESFYEIPLDGKVTRKLLDERGSTRLPAWRGVKYLTPADSSVYQAFASTVSEQKGVARVHLDAFLWPAFKR